MRYTSHVFTGAALAFLIVLLSCRNADTVDHENMSKNLRIGVIIHSKTQVRLEPLVFSSPVLRLKKGDRVTVIGTSKEKTWIGRSCNFWYMIKTDNSIKGWVFGDSIKIFKDYQSGYADSYIANLMQEEENALRKSLTGKWWTVNRKGDFTNHSLLIFENGTYQSEIRGGGVFKGRFNLDFNRKQILFLSKTTFGNTLNYKRRGQLYHLEIKNGKKTLKFMKISDDL